MWPVVPAHEIVDCYSRTFLLSQEFYEYFLRFGMPLYSGWPDGLRWFVALSVLAINGTMLVRALLSLAGCCENNEQREGRRAAAPAQPAERAAGHPCVGRLGVVAIATHDRQVIVHHDVLSMCMTSLSTCASDPAHVDASVCCYA